MMKKRLVILAAVLFLLTGCKEQSPQPVTPAYTEPTLPEFDETLTPKQHLQSAIGALKEHDFTVSYGSGWQEELTLTTGKGDDLRALIPNEHLIEQFCAMGMMVIPSNDGIFCYQVTGLTLDEICNLVCGRSLTEEEQNAVSDYSEVEGTVQIGVDADRILQFLQVDIDLSGNTWSIQITFDKK